jgi:lipopolysaccharide biosynthesis glycosyltransferase
MSTLPVHVVLASDDGYAKPLAVAGRSLVANLRPGRELEIYILDMGIAEENKAAIVSSLKGERVTLTWISNAKAGVQGLPTFAWFTTATYARLLIPDFLPAHVDRVLYLDSDVIVRKCVGPLYDANLEGYAALAVPDYGAAFVCCPWGLANWFESGRNASDINFNAGVMLINVDLWRRENVGRNALDYVGSDRHWRNQDQEALNSTIGTRMGPIDPRWNQQGELFKEECAVVLPWSRIAVREVRENPWIVHYSLQEKPWIHGCSHPWTSEWFMYLDQTAWSGWRPPGPKALPRMIRPVLGCARRLAKRLGLA